MLREKCSPAEREALRGATASSSASVAAIVGPRITSEVVEVMYVIGLDGLNHVMFLTEVARGGRSSQCVYPADLYRIACATNASAIVLAHNHPSGDPTPSPEDLAMTKRIVEAGAVLGIPLVDHVILAPSGRYSSLLDLGVIGPAGDR
jgi:DNA repair protein RadC